MPAGFPDLLANSLALLLLALLLSLYRSIKGPGLYNRLLAINHFSFQSVMFIAIFGFYSGRPDFLDIALMYVLIGFVGAIAVLKYHEYRYLGDGGPGNLPSGWRAYPEERSPGTNPSAPPPEETRHD